MFAAIPSRVRSQLLVRSCHSIVHVGRRWLGEEDEITCHILQSIVNISTLLSSVFAACLVPRTQRESITKHFVEKSCHTALLSRRPVVVSGATAPVTTLRRFAAVSDTANGAIRCIRDGCECTESGDGCRCTGHKHWTQRQDSGMT